MSQVYTNFYVSDGTILGLNLEKDGWYCQPRAFKEVSFSSILHPYGTPSSW